MSAKAVVLSPQQKRNRRICILLFLAAVFIFYSLWARLQAYNDPPDESMRFDVVYFIANHGALPDGRDPEIRNEMWGISYAFNPILAYMIMAIPVKIASFFTDSLWILVLSARYVNVVFGTLTAFLTVLIGEKLFSGKEKYLFISMVVFLPEFIFINSYVNIDSMAVLATALIVYLWIRVLESGWTWKICLAMGASLSLCALSYYNAYGYILCSLIFFIITIMFCRREGASAHFLITRAAFIILIVAILAGWWFLRNYMLYDGDILGSKTSTAYAEMYAIEELKPSNRETPQSVGVSLLGMLFANGSWNHNWLATVAMSFVGTFGAMTIPIPEVIWKSYILYYALAAVGVLCSLRVLFSLKRSKVEYSRELKAGRLVAINKKIIVEDSCSIRSVFNWTMLAAMIIPIVLLTYYAYASDYQAQGRYLMPMLIPFMYFVTSGIKKIVSTIIRNEKAQSVVYVVLTAIFAVTAVYVYATVLVPYYLG